MDKEQVNNFGLVLMTISLVALTYVNLFMTVHERVTVPPRVHITKTVAN